MKANGDLIDWTPENVATLTALWDEGLSTRLIGERMGITKNAVIGKARRLNLQPRPSPVQKRRDRLASETPRHPAAEPESFIKPLTKAQLMGRRA